MHTVASLEQPHRCVLNINAWFAKANRTSRLMPACPVLRNARFRKRGRCGPKLGQQPRSRLLARMKHPSIRRLFDYWNERRGARLLPRREDIEPEAIRC